VNSRLSAVHELEIAEAREYAGLHRYDGIVQDLSPSGISAGLARLGVGPAEPDPHDQAHLVAAEAGLRTVFGVAEAHRWNPMVHLANLDLACYDREYAPAEERLAARRRHLAAWPDAVDASINSLDAVPAPVASALLPAARGLTAALSQDEPGAAEGRAAVDRLTAHFEAAATSGRIEAGLGSAVLASLMADGEAISVDLGRLAEHADAESARLKGLLADACAALSAGTPQPELIDSLLRDHPDADGIYAAAGDLIEEATAFTIDHGLLADPGGRCLVGPAPGSRRYAMAMMSWSAPFEADAPSWYHVTPPDDAWPAEQQEEWLAVFSRTTLPAITVHEVTPGHYAHGRMLRTVAGDVRRSLFSAAFVEGWAHYAEELLLEEGFRAEDPRYCIGVCIEALLRVTRLRAAIGLHTSAMTLDEVVRSFETDAFLRGPAARSEAVRATFDPTYGRYTWGKLLILDLREQARASWRDGYSHRRFHEALLALGAPPLGLIGDALA